MSEVDVSYNDAGEIEYVRLNRSNIHFTYKDSIKKEIENTLNVMGWAENNIFDDERYTKAWNEYMSRYYGDQLEYIDALLEALSYFVNTESGLCDDPEEIRNLLVRMTKGKKLSSISVLDNGLIYIRYQDNLIEKEALIGQLESKNLLDII